MWSDRKIILLFTKRSRSIWGVSQDNPIIHNERGTDWCVEWSQDNPIIHNERGTDRCVEWSQDNPIIHNERGTDRCVEWSQDNPIIHNERGTDRWSDLTIISLFTIRQWRLTKHINVIYLSKIIATELEEVLSSVYL